MTLSPSPHRAGIVLDKSPGAGGVGVHMVQGGGRVRWWKWGWGAHAWWRAGPGRG